MNTRLTTSYHCTHCGAMLKPGTTEQRLSANERELVVQCHVCGNAVHVPLGGVNQTTATPREQSRVAVAEPPFRDLVLESEQPPFAPLPEPDDTANRKRTLTERWNSLNPRTQKTLVATVACAVILGGAFWPRKSEAFPPRQPQNEEPPIVKQQEAPALQLAVLRKYLVTSKPIPLNTPITNDNANHYFAVLEAQTIPQGALTTPEALYGKFAQRDIANNQVITSDLFGMAVIAPPPHELTPPKLEISVSRVITTSGVVEYHYAKVGDGYRLIEVKPIGNLEESPSRNSSFRTSK